MALCGCNLKEKLKCSNGIHVGKKWHQIRLSRSGERQKICRIVAMKISGNILCSGELDGLCCRWDAYHQNLDMIDDTKHLPGTWIWKPFTIVLFVRRKPEVCCLCLITAAENFSVQNVFWSLGPLSKTCLHVSKTAATQHFPRTLGSLVSVQLWQSKLRGQYFTAFYNTHCIHLREEVPLLTMHSFVHT